MSTRKGQVAAIDLGATSGRVVVAEVGTAGIVMRQPVRFANNPVPLRESGRVGLHWNVPELFARACAGLADQARACDNLMAVGIDSWAVDYALLRSGRMLGLPYHYRDERTAEGVRAVHARVTPQELYRRNGLQHLPFTTVFQLAAEQRSGLLDVADRAVLIPDLIGYWLTGELRTERTNASTTGLLTTEGDWDTALLQELGLPTDLFPALVEPGEQLGTILPDVAEPYGLPNDLAVTTVGSHDTASAIAAIPLDPTTDAYISCGTWGLVGVESERPILTEEGRAAGFTNEVGVDGRIRYLHNVMGLWLLSESLRQYRRDGLELQLPDLLERAAQVPGTAVAFDTGDPAFAGPGDMPARIRQWYEVRDLPVPSDPVELVRCIVESLAVAFADRTRKAAELAGVSLQRLHMVGGGSQNGLLCQLTADRLGLPVVAGLSESTALGNIVIAARASGLLHGDLASLRSVVARQFPSREYLPRTRRDADSRPNPYMPLRKVSQ